MYIPEAIDLLYQSYEIARGWLIQMQKQSDPSYATLAKYLHDQESIAPKETTPEWSNIWHTDNKLAAAITALLNDNKKKLSSIFMLGSFSQSPRLDKLKQCFSTIDTSCKTGYLTQTRGPPGRSQPEQAVDHREEYFRFAVHHRNE
jgi:hypothetical protein